jgi:hypothetical protein
LNGNGIDELIITSLNSSSDLNPSYTTQIYSLNCTLCTNNVGLLLGSTIYNQVAVPFLFKNDIATRIFSFQQQNQRILYQYSFVNNTYFTSNFASLVSNTKNSSFNAVDKHFASIIDLNNDCFADLMIVSLKN